MRSSAVPTLAILAFSTFGCGNEPTSGKAPKPVDQAAAPATAPATDDNPALAMKALSLDTMGLVGLTADVPADASVNVAGVAPFQILKLKRDDFFATFSRTSKGEAHTLDDAKKEATASYAGASHFTEEKLVDGWILSFDATGNEGPERVVEALRTVDGKSISCSVTSRTYPKAAAALCRSLRK